MWTIVFTEIWFIYTYGFCQFTWSQGLAFGLSCPTCLSQRPGVDLKEVDIFSLPFSRGMGWERCKRTPEFIHKKLKVLVLDFFLYLPILKVVQTFLSPLIYHTLKLLFICNIALIVQREIRLRDKRRHILYDATSIFFIF